MDLDAELFHGFEADFVLWLLFWLAKCLEQKDVLGADVACPVVAEAIEEVFYLLFMNIPEKRMTRLQYIIPLKTL